MNTALFVYGTLKSGHRNHRFLAGQKFLGEGRTEPGFQLFEITGFPGMVPHSDDCEGVTGEVWSVDAEGLRQLDEFEGIAEGLFRREAVPLRAPFAGQVVQAYIYARSLHGRRNLGSSWTE